MPTCRCLQTPHRFLYDGIFAALRPDEPRLYFSPLLAADRRSLSFATTARSAPSSNGPLNVTSPLATPSPKDLIAFDGSRFQVLSLPDVRDLSNPHPLADANHFNDRNRAAIL